MADTNFSGELMGIESAVFNPSYSSVSKMNMTIPAVTDMATVDYLVHGKNTMTQVFDVTLGDIPYHTVEKVYKDEPIIDKCPEGKIIPDTVNPKWYDTKTWNKMMVAMRHKVPATCSFSKNPEYTIIHTAPTHSLVQDPVVFEIPESMTETVPLITKKTSKVVYERDDSRDNMDYDEAYASVTGKALSPFFGMKGMKLINAKLNYIGGFEDKEEEDADEYDPLYGVDYIDESDAEIEHARSMKAYTERLLKAAHNVDEFHREHKLSGSILSWSYKMSRAMTWSGMMEGVDALNEYKATSGAFVFNEFENSHCPEHYTVDEMDDLAIHSIYTEDSTVVDEPIDDDSKNAIGRVHYRVCHWNKSDVVETSRQDHAPITLPFGINSDVKTRAQERVAKTFGASVLNLVKPQPFRKGVNSKFPVAEVVAIEDEVVFFGAPNMVTHKLSNTSSYLHHHVEKVVERSADVKTIMAVLTSEPKLAREIGELVGMSDRKVGNLLKTAAKTGLVKVVTVKNKATEFHPRASYYI